MLFWGYHLPFLIICIYVSSELCVCPEWLCSRLEGTDLFMEGSYSDCGFLNMFML